VRIGIVSDVHCNIAGLRRAVDLMGDVDELLCLGDSVYEFRFSNDVVGYLRDRDAQLILGNHDEVLLGHHGERARAREGVDSTLVSWLGEQPHRRSLTIGGVRILMVHSTPFEPYGMYVTARSAELARFGDVDADVVLYGHTHQQLVHRLGDVLVVNPGSAGDGRDPRNGRQLSFAVFDTDSRTASITDFADPTRASE
jgi:putative phosphoesterase